MLTSNAVWFCISTSIICCQCRDVHNVELNEVATSSARHPSLRTGWCGNYTYCLVGNLATPLTTHNDLCVGTYGKVRESILATYHEMYVPYLDHIIAQHTPKIATRIPSFLGNGKSTSVLIPFTDSRTIPLCCNLNTLGT